MPSRFPQSKQFIVDRQIDGEKRAVIRRGNICRQCVSLKTPDITGECAKNAAPGFERRIADDLFSVIKDKGAVKGICINKYGRCYREKNCSALAENLVRENSFRRYGIMPRLFPQALLALLNLLTSNVFHVMDLARNSNRVRRLLFGRLSDRELVNADRDRHRSRP